MDHAVPPDPVPIPLREGFGRIATVLRADLRNSAGQEHFNTVQAQVLTLLATRPAGLQAKEIAAHLKVSAPSIADTLAALERNESNSSTASRDPADARAVTVRLTDEGRAAAAAVDAGASQVTNALLQLSRAEQADLLLTQVKLIQSSNWATFEGSGRVPPP